MRCFRALAFVPLLLFACCLPAVEFTLPPVWEDKPAEKVDYFPNRTSLFVWRNWNVVPLEKMAALLQTSPEKVSAMAERLGLEPYREPTFNPERLYITIVRRNWHILPYDQICFLIDKTASQFANSIIEDDFLWVKLGSLKPACEPLTYEEPTERQWERIDQIGALVRAERPVFDGRPSQRLDFIDELKAPLPQDEIVPRADSRFEFRFVSSYFALFGDPLATDTDEIYPEGLLQRLANVGVNGVWLHVVLRDIAPGNDDFPEFGVGYEKRQENLRRLVERAKKYGISVYLYMNEPRAMQEAFFEHRQEMAGVTGGQRLRAICTSTPQIKKWIGDALANLFTNVPGLGGVFTITASENLTTCASHGGQAACPRCSKRTHAEIIAEINSVIAEGVHRAAPDAKVIVWDWGWTDGPDIIKLLPKDVWLQSVSEWSLELNRGGVREIVGEYSISAVGPGPRALNHWECAKRRGLKTSAKVQFNTTWECGSVPFIPAMDLVARHCHNLAETGVEGMMLCWSLGGYPSPNLQIAQRFSGNEIPSVDEVLDSLAQERYGEGAPLARRGWTALSEAFQQFPYDCQTIYVAPVHVGPANPLRLRPSGFSATMVGIPFDDLNAWRGPYPPEVFIDQLEKTAAGFAPAIELLKQARAFAPEETRKSVDEEIRCADNVRINYLSAAQQARFVLARDEYLGSTDPQRRAALAETMREMARRETALAKELYLLTLEDSKIGFESTNQYYYLPNDLIEKIICDQWVIDTLAQE